MNPTELQVAHRRIEGDVVVLYNGGGLVLEPHAARSLGVALLDAADEATATLGGSLPPGGAALYRDDDGRPTEARRPPRYVEANDDTRNPTRSEGHGLARAALGAALYVAAVTALVVGAVDLVTQAAEAIR